MGQPKKCLILLVALMLIFTSLGVSFQTPQWMVVNSQADDGDGDWNDGICATMEGLCTFRAALEQAMFIGEPAVIGFNLMGEEDFHLIQIGSTLPVITQSVFVDGTTQPGGGEIILDGSELGLAYGLQITGVFTHVQGLTFQGFNTGIWLNGAHQTIIRDVTVRNSLLDGLLITNGGSNFIGGESPAQINYFYGNKRNGLQIFESDDNVIQGNWIGVQSDLNPNPNLGNGILVTGKSINNFIGGAEETQVNVIASNLESQIRITYPATGNFVKGNFIQALPEGSFLPVENQNAIEIKGSSFNQIGGETTGEGNFVCGSIFLGPDDIHDINASENSILGNQIGTSADGLLACEAQTGVTIHNSFDNLIKGNRIAGYTDIGIELTGPLANGNIIQTNTIGLSANETALAGKIGISIYKGEHNLIGGTEPEEGNTIAFHSGNGVELTSKTILEGYIERFGSNRIRGNRIFGNGGLGIELHPEVAGPNLNDAFDLDEGPNGLQNSPEFDTLYYNGSNLVFDLSLDIPVAEMPIYDLDFFVSSSCDPSGYGEGEHFILSEEVSGSSEGVLQFSASWSVEGDVLGKYLTATATDPYGNTSEFSQCSLIDYPYHTYLPLIMK